MQATAISRGTRAGCYRHQKPTDGSSRTNWNWTEWSIRATPNDYGRHHVSLKTYIAHAQQVPTSRNMRIAGVLSFFIRTSDFAAEAEAKLNVLIFFSPLLITKDCKLLELASLWHNNLTRQFTEISDLCGKDTNNNNIVKLGKKKVVLASKLAGSSQLVFNPISTVNHEVNGRGHNLPSDIQ